MTTTGFKPMAINKNRRVNALNIALSVWLGLGASLSLAAAPDRDAGRFAFRVGKVITMDGGDRVINNAVVLVSAGKIERVGPAAKMEVPDGYRVIDARDKWLAPGLIDCHSHAVSNSLWLDLNDMVYLTNPGLRLLETIEPENEFLKNARAGGVTAMLMIPGSGTNMGGFGAVSKAAGRSVDDMVMRSPGSLKIAQAGNPEWYWYGVGRSFMNYNTRQTLTKAKAYHDRWVAYESGAATEPPEFDPIFDGFRGLFAHKYPVTVHTQIYQVVMTTIDMLANKLHIRTVLDHCTFDGYKTAPMAVAADVYAINGPRQYHFDRAERRMNGNAARWWQGGVRKLGINTDAPVIPQEELPYQAAMACWYGWKPYAALKGLTRIPAEALMIDNRVGTIEPGKDADFGIWTGDPLDPRSSCELTMIDGRIVYAAAVKRRF